MYRLLTAGTIEEKIYHRSVQTAACALPGAALLAAGGAGWRRTPPGFEQGIVLKYCFKRSFYLRAIDTIT